MIEALNRPVDLVEERLTEEIDVGGLAMSLGTTGYHPRATVTPSVVPDCIRASLISV